MFQNISISRVHRNKLHTLLYHDEDTSHSQTHSVLLMLISIFRSEAETRRTRRLVIVSCDAPRADTYTGSVYVSTITRARLSSILHTCAQSEPVRGPPPVRTHASPPSDPQPMAAEPAADDHGPRPPLADGAVAAGGGDASSAAAAAEALMSAASEQLTLVYQGDVFIFDPVPPQKVAPLAPPAKSIAPSQILFPWFLYAALTCCDHR